MAIEASDITAAPGAAPAPVSPDVETPESSESELPEELLSQPFLAALMQGTPPAAYVENNFTSPEVELVLKHADALAQAGFRIYPATSKPVTVLFNAVSLSPEELSKADKEGKLDQVAVPFTELQEVFAGAGSQPAEGASPAAPAPASATASAPAAPPTNDRLTNARIKNTSPGQPTSGPTPGQGRLISNIVKPVI